MLRMTCVKLGEYLNGAQLPTEYYNIEFDRKIEEKEERLHWITMRCL